MGRILSLPNACIELPPPVAQDVTFFGDRVIAAMMS